MSPPSTSQPTPPSKNQVLCAWLFLMIWGLAAQIVLLYLLGSLLWGCSQSSDGSCRGPWLFRRQKGTNRNYKTFYDQVSGAHTVWLLSLFTGQCKSFILQNIREMSIQGCERIDLFLGWEAVTHYRDDRKCEFFFLVFNITHFYYEPKLMSNFHYTLAALFTPIISLIDVI